MNETLDDIVSWIREIAQSYKQSTAYDKVTIEGLKVCDALEKIACRIEAARKCEVDRIKAKVHEAMVLIAGIETTDPDNPRGLWTALEDAYDELADAIGTDGDIKKDADEAKARGRHVVVPAPLAGACFAGGGESEVEP